MKTALVAVTLLGLVLAGCSDKDAQRQLEDAKAELAKAKDKLAAANEQVRFVQGGLDKLKNENRSLAGEAEPLARRNEDLMKKNTELMQKNAELAQQLVDSVAALAKMSQEAEALRRGALAVAAAGPASASPPMPGALQMSQPAPASKPLDDAARAALVARKRELEANIAEIQGRIGQVNSTASGIAKASVDVRIVAAPGLLGNRDHYYDRYYDRRPGTTLEIQRGDYRTLAEKDAAITAAKRPLAGLLAELRRAQEELADVKRELLAQPK